MKFIHVQLSSNLVGHKIWVLELNINGCQWFSFLVYALYFISLLAKGLDLYQVLAPNAYSFREEFIPVIRKTVQSQVHSKAMAQFQWHDGTLKNVHVDMATLFEYQKQLGAMVKLFEKRIDWLSTSSRRIFGTVTEKK